MSYRSQRIILTALSASAVIGLLCLQNGATAAENPLFAKAKEEYTKQNYFSAIHGFKQVCEQDPHNGLAHYYLANSYVKIQEMYKAADEYKACLSAGTDPVTADYCRQALSGLNGKKNSAGKTVVPAVNSPPLLTGTSESLPLPASFHPKVSEEAKRRIREQTEKELARLRQTGDALSKDHIRDGKDAASRIREEGKAIVYRMSNEYEMDMSGRGSHKKYSESQLEAMKAYYESQAKSAEAHGQRNSDSASAHFGKRQASINETADSLTSQLSRTPGLADSTAIEPLGTNLYVRNYQPISRMLENRPPVQPAIARQGALPGVSPQTANADAGTDPLSARQSQGKDRRLDSNAPAGASGSSQQIVQTKVRGELLR